MAAAAALLAAAVPSSWLAAQVTAATLRPRAPVQLAFVGDVNLGTSTLVDGVPPDSARTLLAAARPALTGDLVILNYEGAIADSGRTDKCGPLPRPRRTRARPAAAPVPPPPPPPAWYVPVGTSANCYAFLTPTWLVPALREAGFTHANLANNHALDFGEAGLASTRAALEAGGLRTYGPGGAISVDTIVRGDSVTIVGLVGFTTYDFAPDLRDIERSAALVDSVRRSVDLLVVTFHGGGEGLRALRVPHRMEYLGREKRGELRKWARAVVAAGADLVVGHGPHVLRGLEQVDRALVAYSLGNFATYNGFNVKAERGLTAVLQVTVRGPGDWTARLVPFRQAPQQGPAPETGGVVLALVRQLSREDFGARAPHIAEDGTVTPRSTP